MDRNVLPGVIETARLRLRPWAIGDVEDVLAYARDPEWSKYLRVLPRPYRRGDAERFVARQLLLDPVTHPAWAIVVDGTVSGGINIRLDFQHRLGEIGYALARLHWHRGYATEAARAVVDAAFEAHPDLNRIHARADVENRGSQRVMEKIGMIREGVLRESRVERGELVDEVWYGILRREWSPAAGV